MSIIRYPLAEIKSIQLCLQNGLLNCLPDCYSSNRIVRPFFARILGMQCGYKVLLRKNIYYGSLHNIKIGNKTVINREVFLDAYDLITIGNNVSIAFRAALVTSTHEYGLLGNSPRTLYGKPIVIEDDVWICAGAIIGPGVTIGAGSIVSSGAVVMRSTPSNSLVAGVPARVIKRLESSRDLFCV